jgi:tetratricopeptide (TPR) repeat protein
VRLPLFVLTAALMAVLPAWAQRPAPVAPPAAAPVPAIPATPPLAAPAAPPDVFVVAAEPAAMAFAWQEAAPRAGSDAERAARDKARAGERVFVLESRERVRSCRADARQSTAGADELYACGRHALDRAEWDQALQAFTRAASIAQGTRAIGAAYWRAYAQNRLGQRAEALATLGELKRAHPSSGWAADASALEVQIRQWSGQRVSPDLAPDDDIRLLALQGLAQRDVTTAVPMIEGLLKGAHAPRLKERALFVLAHSGKPEGREIVVRVARGGANPDLQLKAVEYVGLFRTPEASKVLAEVYATTDEAVIKRAVLRGYSHAEDRARLLSAARDERAPELRLEAVRQLGNLKAGTELGELYGRESSAEVKKQILRGLAVAGLTERLLTVAATDSDRELRRTALRSLGLVRDPAVTTQLVALYAQEPATEVREAIVDAFHTQGNAAALVTLARQEKDPALRRRLVSRLSTMQAKEATEYLVELLK